jgi:hypothetical protein
MEPESILVGAAVPVILGLLALLGVMWRGRNGKNGNPGSLARIQTLCEQQLLAAQETRASVAAIQLTLAAMETTVGACGAVQEHIRRGN